MKQNPVIMATIVAIGLLTLTATTNVQAKTWFDQGWEDGRDDARNNVDE